MRDRNINKSYKLCMDISVFAAYDFDHGSLIVDVAVRGQPHPIFTVAMAVSCKDDIEKNVPFLTCPLQKGCEFSFIFINDENISFPKY